MFRHLGFLDAKKKKKKKHNQFSYGVMVQLPRTGLARTNTPEKRTKLLPQMRCNRLTRDE